MPASRTAQVGPGKTYSTLSGALAGEQAIGNDLPTRDEIMIFECYSFQDTTNVVIDGWTTDATRYIRVYTPTAERHDGKYNNSKYRLEITSANGIDVFESFVRLEGLQIMVTEATSTARRGILLRGLVGNYRISNCIVKGVLSGTATGHGIEAFGDSPLRIWNTIVYDFVNGTTVCRGFYNDGDGSTFFYNCTAQNCWIGFADGLGTTTCKNCLSQSCNDGFSGTFTNSNDNCSDIASDAPGTNPETGSVTFVDAASDDFHLASGDTVAKDKGEDLSAGDGTITFTDDIDGVTRSGSWDIGADEFTVSGGAVRRRRRILV
jgi:hypothetical protein